MRILHVQAPIKKHIENSLRGVARAARGHYDAIDLDMQITADNRIIGTHWARPMIHDGFHDPAHRISRFRPVSRLSFAQVRHLVAAGGYRIQPIEVLIRACARRGVIALIEPKGDRRFTEDWVWQHIAKVADDFGAEVQVRSLYQRNVDAAKRNGFKAWKI